MSFVISSNKGWRQSLAVMYFLVGICTVVIIGSMFYILYEGREMTAKHDPLIDAAMEIKLEVTIAHLWFEEIISGDRHESIDSVWEHLSQADWYARAMLEGGENAEGKFYPLSDAGMCGSIKEVRQKLSEFRSISARRLKHVTDSRVGSDIDQRYDAVFDELIVMADGIKSQIQNLVGKELKNFHSVQLTLIIGCLLLSVFVGIRFDLFIRSKRRYELQLQADEQQLQAANQQLISHEQQLRANEEDLKETNHSLGERVKELNCLYGLSQLAERDDIELEDIFHELAELIPPGWQYPEITAARITFEERQFETSNFRETAWIQSADIKVYDQKSGTIEVCYLEKMAVIDGELFLKEERSLLNALAERLGKIISRKQAEDTLRIERNNLKNTFGAMEDGVYIVNQQYDIQYVNPVLRKDYGLYEGRKCYEYFHDRTEVCPWCKNPDVFAGKTVRWEWFSSKNGKTYDLIDTPFKNPDGSISKLEIFRDITELKQHQEKLKNYREHLEELVGKRTEELEKTNKQLQQKIVEHKQAEKALKLSEFNLNKAQEVARMGSWNLDLIKNELHWSDETHRIFGLNSKSTLTYEKFLEIVHPDDTEYVNNSWKAALKKEPFDIEHRIIVNGKVKWVKEKAEIVCNEQGEAISGIGTVQDITEKRIAEETARQKEIELAVFRERLTLLTRREFEIMKLVVAGKLSKQIAFELGISSKTVENHRASIMKKLKMQSIADLTRYVTKADI